MSLDPAIRIAALHAAKPEVARALLFAAPVGTDPLRSEQILKIVENAIHALEEAVEIGIVQNSPDLTIDVEVAELIMFALKSRRKQAGRPSLTSAQRATRAATVEFAISLSSAKRRGGMPAGAADEEAAKEAAVVGGQHGANIAWTTILRQMKGGGKKPRV